MKSMLFVLFASAYFISDSVAFGATPSSGFILEYRFEGKSYTYQTDSSEFLTALQDGADACFKFYKNGQFLNEERGIDLIDVCANPRQKKGT